MNTKIESPSEGRKDSYLSLVAEFLEQGEPLIPFPLSFANTDFPALIREMEDCTKGIGVPEGFAAHETFWLVDDDEVVAVSNLRFHLTENLKRDGGHIGYGVRPSARRRGYATFLLAETLKKAQQRGIPKTLVTCYKGNVGSAKTIIKNGGVLDSEELMEGHDDVMQRYWIAIT